MGTRAKAPAPIVRIVPMIIRRRTMAASDCASSSAPSASLGPPPVKKSTSDSLSQLRDLDSVCAGRKKKKKKLKLIIVIIVIGAVSHTPQTLAATNQAGNQAGITLDVAEMSQIGSILHRLMSIYLHAIIFLFMLHVPENIVSLRRSPPSMRRVLLGTASSEASTAVTVTSALAAASSFFNL